MNLKFSFDTATVERRGFTLEDVHLIVKSLFAAHDFPCVSGGDVLSFTDKGHGDDFAVMWDIILVLLRAGIVPYPVSSRTKMGRKMCCPRSGKHRVPYSNSLLGAAGSAPKFNDFTVLEQLRQRRG